MTFATEMADLVVELLGPDGEFGEAATVRRPGSGYDPVTRRATTGDELVMHMRGTFDSSLSRVAEGALTRRFERSFAGYVALEGGDTEFEPGAGDTIEGDGKTWNILEAAPTRKQGTLILYEFGLAT